MLRRPLALAALAGVLLLGACQSGEDKRADGKPASGAEASDAARGEIERLLAARAAAEASGDAAALQGIMMELGLQEASLGDYRGAETSFREALDALERRAGADAEGAADPLMHVGLMASLDARPEEARLLFERAERALKVAPNPSLAARLLSYRAIDQANRGDFDKALALAKEATTARRAFLSGAVGAEGRLTVAAVLIELAQGLYIEASLGLRLGKLDEASLAGELARRIAVELPDTPPWWVGHIDELLALVDIERGNLASAEARAARAVLTKRRAFGETRPAGLAFLALAQVQQKRGEVGAAIDTARRGVGLVGTATPSRSVAVDRLGGFLLAAAEQARRDPGARERLHAEMFEAAQLAGDGVAGQAISRVAARLAERDPRVAALVRRTEDLQQLRDQLRLDLGREAALPSRERDAARIERLRDSYVAARDRAVAAEAELRAAAPAYAGLVALQPVPAARVAAALRPGEALLNLVIGSRESFAFLLRAGSAPAVARLAIGRDAVAAHVTALRRAFQVTGGAVADFDLARSHALYQALLAPLAGELATVRTLFVVAPGALGSLPFGLLVTEPPGEGTDYAQAAWLARRVATAQMPSIRAFADLRTAGGASRASRPFIGIGNPRFAGATAAAAEAARAECRNGKPMQPAALNALVPLPGTAREVQTVARQLGAGGDAVLLGPAATEPAVARLPLDQYRVVYFATHGLLPNELVCQAEPALALTPPGAPAAQRGGDGLLEASEIAALRLDADLVVLSACNTAGGAGEFGGEALSGLARAFFHAGARAMLVSHWVVESEATVALMTDLFGQWKSGATPEALRAAQMKMLADPARQHPFFWGPFTVVGAG